METFLVPRSHDLIPDAHRADLTEVEFVSRDVARRGLEFFRRHMPGFERAWILDTASQVGTRHARRLAGLERVTIEHWRDDGAYPDTIGLCPGMTPSFPTLEIPYRSLVPRGVSGLLAAGRNLSADTKSHAALREIPYGEVRTYADIAQEVGKPGAIRAVGSACGANRVPLSIPCHRVIRTDGSLGGFGWGLEVKETLLAAEAQ